MAAEMERLKMEQKRDAKMRQQIRETRCCKMCLSLLRFCEQHIYIHRSVQYSLMQL